MSPLLRWALWGSLGASLLVLVALPEPAADAQAEAADLLAPRLQRPPDAAAALPRAAAAATATATNIPKNTAMPTVRSADWPAPPPAALAAWAPTPELAARPVSEVRDVVASAPMRSSAPAAAAAASAPGAPNFPYRYIGHLDDGQGVRVFIASAQQTWALLPGQTLDSQWRLDGFQPGQLQLTWLPGGTAVSVPTR